MPNVSRFPIADDRRDETSRRLSGLPRARVSDRERAGSAWPPTAAVDITYSPRISARRVTAGKGEAGHRPRPHPALSRAAWLFVALVGDEDVAAPLLGGEFGGSVLA